MMMGDKTIVLSFPGGMSVKSRNVATGVFIFFICLIPILARIIFPHANAHDQFRLELIDIVSCGAIAAALFIGYLQFFRRIQSYDRKMEQLRLQTARFINYYEYAGDAIVLLDQDTFLDCNNRTLEIYGCRREDIIGQSPKRFSPEYQPNGRRSDEFSEEIIQAALTGKPQLFEWKHFRLDGTPFDTEVTLTMIEVNGKKFPQAIIRDITARKKAETELEHYRHHLEELVTARTTELEAEIKIRQKAEEEMRQIFNIAGDGMVVFDTNRKVIAVNDRMCRMTGKKREELLRSEDCQCADFGFDETDCTIKKVLAEQVRLEFDGEMSGAEGKIPCIMTLVPYYDAAGNLHGVILSVKDISDRLKAEAAATAEAEQRGRLLMTNDMLHDIGNALAGIDIFAIHAPQQQEWQEIVSLHQLKDFLADEAEPLSRAIGPNKQAALTNFLGVLLSALQDRKAQEAAALEKLSRTVKHISSILELHHYYARNSTESGSAIINLRQLLDDALTILSCNLEKRKIKVILDASSAMLLVSGDRTRLMRLFINIIKNSYEAFNGLDDSRARTLAVVLNAIPAENEAEVTITDNAAGFTPEIGARLFDRGFTTKGNGSGIGLPECRAVAESHGGTISMTSPGPNLGATAKIRLPLYRRTQGEAHG